MNDNNDEKLNYKFTFFGIFCAYSISQALVLWLKPEWTNYITILQVFLILIPLVFIYFSASDTYTIPFTTAYKLNFKFNTTVIPCILWALFGINLLSEGTIIILQHILPVDTLAAMNKMLGFYTEQLIEMAQVIDGSFLDFVLLGTCITVIPAVCEEFLFRGYLMQNIAIHNSSRYAIIMSAFIFAAIHLNPITFVPIFILGLFLGKMFYVTNSLVPAILLHFFNNLITFLSVNFIHNSDTTYWNLPLGIIFFIAAVIILIVVYFTLIKIEKLLHYSPTIL